MDRANASTSSSPKVHKSSSEAVQFFYLPEYDAIATPSDVEILQLNLAVTEGHLELDGNAVIADEERIHAEDETVVAKVQPTIARNFIRWLLCCREVKQRDGDGV